MAADNAFGSIHATLRSILNHAARCLQQTNFLDEPTTAIAVDAVATAMHLCREHDANKAGFVFPLLDAFEPSVVAALQQDVLKNKYLRGHIETCLAQWQAAKTPSTKAEAGDQLKRLFMRFLIVTRTNLAREEMLHGFLKKYCTKASLHQIAQTLQPDYLTAV